ncbi:hypothetical protein IIB79_10990, partial [candidate division KSB1 bacterium]|nr:hypothetical protein [candidate division KSB1 bacterium]
MKKTCIYLLSVLLMAASADRAMPQGSTSLEIGYQGNGISLGNSKRVTGLRINIIDRGLERVNGV